MTNNHMHIQLPCLKASLGPNTPQFQLVSLLDEDLSCLNRPSQLNALIPLHGLNDLKSLSKALDFQLCMCQNLLALNDNSYRE